jgi:hypothetical protein
MFEFRLSRAVYEYLTNTVALAIQKAQLDDAEVVALLALLYITNCMSC